MQKNDIYPSYFETFILLLLASVAGFVALPAYLPYLFYKTPLTKNIAEICAYAGAFVISIRYAANCIRKNGGSFSITAFFERRMRWEIVLLLVLCTVGLGITLDYMTHWLNLKDLFATEVDAMAKTPLLAFVSLAILPALLEEFLFRGVLLRQFLKKYSPAHAILLSAFCFGAIHGNPPQVVTGFISGCFLGWIYYRTRNLKYCILIHFTNNAIAWLGLMLNTYRPTNAFGRFMDSLTTSANGFVMAAVVTIICMMVLQKIIAVEDMVHTEDPGYWNEMQQQ